MASVKKRRNLDFATKLKAVQRVEAGEKSSTVADDIGIPRSTLSTLLKNKADIKAKAAEQRTSGACRVRATAHGKVEKALYAWFLEVRAKNIPVDGPMLMAKAKWFAAALGEDNFGDNTGWLHRFKQRYNIVGKTISGESEAVRSQDIQQWLTKEWPEISAKFSPAEIFNADETGLFWQMLPSKTLDVRGSTCHGGKMSKVRVSVLLAANMDGSRKLQPFVIGKARAPRCFKNCKQLPVRYASNKKAWMTRQLFTEWLQAWDVELGKSGRRACLLVDNCSAHHTTCELKNIELKFLPANTTAKLQPLDQGIIKSFKVGYRRRLLDRLLVNLRMGTELKVDLLGAIQMLTGAWRDVKTDTVANCFRKAGFVTAELAETGEDGDEERIDDAFRELSTLFPAAVPPEVSADDFVEVDCNVQAVASLADEDIVAAVAGTQDAQADSSSGDEDRPNEAAATRAYSAAEVAAAFGLIRRCCGDMEGTGLSHLDSLDKIEASVFNFILKTKKQAKISDFFSRK